MMTLPPPTLDSDTKNRFIARRYMDDILMFYSRSGEWDHERFLKDFERSDCYMPPLCLEEGQAGTFLETNFQITSANGVRTWLKSNPSKGGNWKYAHYGSHSSKAQKRAVLVACLKKINLMASDKGILTYSALMKLEEFRKLRYPVHLLRKVCAQVATTTGEGAWIGIRNRV